MTGHRRFAPRYLDPASRLGEVLFGLIMVLTITLTAGLTVGAGRDGVRQLLIAALGCNIAWGIIDGIMYIMNCMVERSHRARFLRAVRSAPDRSSALDTVRSGIDTEFGALAGPAERDRLAEAILDSLDGTESAANGVTRDDLYGAVACFWLVFVSCIPAAIPFFFMSEPRAALRVSNLLLTGMLFVLGWQWGRFADSSPVYSGLAMVLVGLALVGVAVALGG